MIAGYTAGCNFTFEPDKFVYIRGTLNQNTNVFIPAPYDPQPIVIKGYYYNSKFYHKASGVSGATYVALGTNYVYYDITSGKYYKCTNASSPGTFALLGDGSTLDAWTGNKYKKAYTQTLPTEEDGYYYLQLGKAYYNSSYYLGTYQLNLMDTHPVFYYKNGQLCEYTGIGVVNTVDDQIIAGNKTFNNDLVTDSILVVREDQTSEYATDRPTDQTGLGAGDDLDAYYYTTGITVMNCDEETKRQYSYPAKSGTFAMTSDLADYLPLTGGTITGNLTAQNASILASGTSNIGSTETAFNNEFVKTIYTNKIGSYDMSLNIEAESNMTITSSGADPNGKVTIDGTAIPKNKTLATTDDLLPISTLAESTNLNTLTTEGEYRTTATATLRSLTNAPEACAGSSAWAGEGNLIVKSFGIGNTSYVYQEFIAKGGTRTETYKRVLNGSTWGSWEMVATSGDIPTNYVTTNTDQVITGYKTFTGDVYVGPAIGNKGATCTASTFSSKNKAASMTGVNIVSGAQDVFYCANQRTDFWKHSARCGDHTFTDWQSGCLYNGIGASGLYFLRSTYPITDSTPLVIQICSGDETSGYRAVDHTDVMSCMLHTHTFAKNQYFLTKYKVEVLGKAGYDSTDPLPADQVS